MGRGSRRDFLRMLGLSVGASLIGCGSGEVGRGGAFTGGPSIPNGYRFVPLASSGSVMGKSSILAKSTGEASPFLGGVMINDRRHVCFHANDTNRRKGVFEVDYDSGGSTSEVKQLIKEGDALPDGTVVDDISGGYLNNQDELVFVVTDPDGEKSMQISRGLDSFEALFDEYDQVSAQATFDGDLQQEVGMADNGDILFVCCGKDANGDSVGETLYYTPKDTPSDTVKLLGENELLPGSNCTIRTFGFCEIGNDGGFLVQGSAARVEASESEDGDSSNGQTYLAAGRVGENPEILVAHPSLGINSAIQGAVNMSARLGEGGYGFVCQTSNTTTQLYLNKNKLLEAAIDGTGSLSPRGHRIISMFPPVFGPNQMMLVQVFTTGGTEILSYTGRGFTTILASGDEILGNQINMILFGCLPHSINAFGEFVAVAEYHTGESVVLLGMPV